MPQIGLEFCVKEPFEEASPPVTVDTRSEDPGAIDIECVHPETVAAPTQARYDLT